jgi:hypothetical protein
VVIRGRGFREVVLLIPRGQCVFLAAICSFGLCLCLCCSFTEYFCRFCICGIFPVCLGLFILCVLL